MACGGPLTHDPGLGRIPWGQVCRGSSGDPTWRRQRWRASCHHWRRVAVGSGKRGARRVSGGRRLAYAASPGIVCVRCDVSTTARGGRGEWGVGRGGEGLSLLSTQRGIYDVSMRPLRNNALPANVGHLTDTEAGSSPRVVHRHLRMIVSV